MTHECDKVRNKTHDLYVLPGQEYFDYRISPLCLLNFFVYMLYSPPLFTMLFFD